ncbi:NAD(P)H-binding protein [Actinomadura oligospora]|uniref:NAD(P)H-binding protein n=1 Tax=Actinomadura oligospora TaxID=111804 RepID=UPI00047CDF67|nr:NAD(P)H-binding protein [Actinomadura oligospora]
MILVTGATGTVGRELVSVLAARGERVRAITRDPAKAENLPDGVEVVRADFTDPGSLLDAAKGSGAVFMLSAPGPWIPEHDEAILAAARSAGVPRAVKLSAISTGDKKEGKDWHLPGERALRSSGLAWTVLRPSSFASNTLGWANAIRAGHPVPNPMGDGAQGVVDPADIAEVSAVALTTSDLDAATLTLTGPELLSTPQMAETLGGVIGRKIELASLTSDAYRERLTAAGLDPDFVTTAVNGARLVASGGNAVVTDDVVRVLGRPARTFADWAAAHRAAFTL